VTRAKQFSSGWANLDNNIYTALKQAVPASRAVWAFTNVCVLPLFGFLMIYHERGHKGSAHPTEERILQENRVTGERVITERKEDSS
jgi:hypothetical protein